MNLPRPYNHEQTTGASVGSTMRGDARLAGRVPHAVGRTTAPPLPKRAGRQRLVWSLAMVALLAVLVLALGLGSVGGEVARELRRRSYRQMALHTQDHTWRVLAYAGGSADCARAPYVTYRRDTRNVGVSDHWYVALQVRADAALVRLGHEQFRCQVDKTVAWMERLWDPGHAGYAPRADLDGSNLTVRDVYADDNAIVGLAFLEAARTTADPAIRARALAGAERAAGYLLNAGLWDDTFGGGLWWNNQRGAAAEGKPAEATALMAHLMAELHAETGRAEYRAWALAALDWLDRALWNDEYGLYAYGVSHAHGDPGRAEVVERYFGYDQAIVIQALVRLHRTEPNAVHLARAQRLGRAFDHAYWHPELGGYTLEAHGADVYVPYAAWMGEALLDLYAADEDPFWRDRARANLDALDRTFLVEPPGGYAMRSFRCIDDMVFWCQPGERRGLDRVIYTMAQAQIQRAAALQAAAY